jgi:hypothetical protein
VIGVLDAYEQLKRTTLPDTAAEQAEPTADGLEELTKAQLLEQPQAEQITGASRMTVDELRAALRAQREQG